MRQSAQLTISIIYNVADADAPLFTSAVTTLSFLFLLNFFIINLLNKKRPI